MINVIKEIMFDCAYENVVQTEITFEEKVYNLNIFKHREVESQIFIVLQILESQLVAQDNYKDLVIEIANYFRENDIYVPDMDKNTSLIYCVKRDIKSNKLDELKVKIEDDPFYFKKYVFAYSEAQSDEFKKLRKQHNWTINELIQTYIFDTENFSKFKKNGDNEKIYKLVSELFIKIPIIPINFETNGEIKSVSEYMLVIKKCNDDELDRLDNIIETLNSPQENMEQLVNKVLEDWGFVGLEENNE